MRLFFEDEIKQIVSVCYSYGVGASEDLSGSITLTCDDALLPSLRPIVAQGVSGRGSIAAETGLLSAHAAAALREPVTSLADRTLA